jgi:ABC-2 type transport system permease protein
MTTTTIDVLAPAPGDEPEETTSSVVWAMRDTGALTIRNLLHYVRVPELLVFTFVQPVMFVLLFRYVFGGSIPIPGLEYVDYLMPGIFVQTVVFGSTATAIGLAEDIGTGIVERFRSLPMTRFAVLAGRTAADLIRNTGVVFVMFVIGVLVGFRPDGGLPRIVLALVLILGFAHALSWIFANVGLRASNAEAAQAISFPILFPLTFASSAFVPVSNMPGWLQAFAWHQPVTIVVNAARALMLGPESAAQLQAEGILRASTLSYTLQSIAWIVGILAVFVPLAVRRFNRL